MLDRAEHPWFWDWHNDEMGSDRNKVWLCKVTVEQIFDRNGKPIIRYKKKK